MAVKIRLKRMGKIRSPHYRIIVIDSRAKRDGKAIEEVGLYHPKNDPSVIKVNSERVQYWLGVGAQPTEAVVAILKASGDWQKFSGDTSPSGIKPQPEPKDKLALFNAALAEADDEPTTSAITTKKKGEEAETSEEPADASGESVDAERDDQAGTSAEEPAEAPAEGADDETAEA